MTEPRFRPDERGGFLSRWSRRKLEQRDGMASVEPPAPPVCRREQPSAAVEDAPSGCDAAVSQISEAPPALPSLADVQTLTPASDFAPFMARGVASSVRNAAMKKLFADPHFNVMDGLDIYIDDYTKTTPLTAAVLKTMTSAKFLGLFDDEETKAPVAETAAPMPPDAAPEPPGLRDGPEPTAELRAGGESSDAPPGPSQEA